MSSEMSSETKPFGDMENQYDMNSVIIIVNKLSKLIDEDHNRESFVMKLSPNIGSGS